MNPTNPPSAPDIDVEREHRLYEIRREAEKHGVVQQIGARPAGAPFPVASPQTGYYGVHLLKEPQWTWEIPIYFFAGGAAGASAVIGAVARWTGKDLELARDARFVAAGGAIVSSALLIADLGRPERFLNMLRVFKPQSPMSVGAWTLAGFGSASGLAALAQLINAGVRSTPVRVIGDLAEGVSAAFGLPFSNYTGVLIGATAIPVWNHNIKTLPVHFGMSAMGASVSVLELLGHDTSTALNTLGIIASALESYEGVHLEFVRNPEINRPLKRGKSGWITRAGGVLSGPLPLLLRVASAATDSRKLRRIASLATLVGSLCTRIGWVQAGHESARDWRIPLGLADKAPRHGAQPLEFESKPGVPQMERMGT
jgi:Polysulphide reductase, NrfD